MKNMKRLIAATLSMGLATMSTINIVACSGGSSTPTPQNNDLTNSFDSGYSVKPDEQQIKLQDLGLKFGVANPSTYDFIASDFTLDTVNKVITAEKGAVITNPIYSPTTAQEAVPTAANQEIAVITAADQTGLMPASVTNPVVNFTVTLTMWKSEIKDTTFVYKSTATQMQVTIYVTVPFRKNLADLTDVIVKIDPTISVSSPEQFANAVVGQLKLQAGYNDLERKNVVITNTVTDSPITADDFKNGSVIVLGINIVASQDPGRFFGSKVNLTANIQYNMDLSGLPGTPDINLPNGGDLTLFNNAMVANWNRIAVYQTLTTAFVVITKGDGSPLAPSDIKAGTMQVKVSPSQTPGGVTGFKLMDVTITIS